MESSRKVLSWLGVTALTLLILAAAQVLTPARGVQASDSGEGWLGVSLQDLTPRLREALELDPDVRGAVVASVVRGSPAHKAGLREGDVIIELGDEKVRSVDDAVDIVRGMSPGSKTLVVVLRDGERRGLGATVGDREASSTLRFVPEADREVREHYGDDPRSDPRRSPRASDQWQEEDAPEAPGQEDNWVFRERERDQQRHRNRIHVAPRVQVRGMNGGYLGVQTMPLGEQLAEYFGVEEREGVLVTSVVEDSPASEAGLLAGDVIVAVGEDEVDSPGELRRLVRRHDPEDAVEITVIRKGSRKTLNATLGKAGDFGNVFILDPEDRMVAIPPLPDLPEPPEIEIIAPHLEDLEHLHLDFEELEGLEDLEFEDLPHLEIILDNHRNSMEQLRKSMRQLRHELREIHREARTKWQREWKQARSAEDDVRRELRELEREQRDKATEARERAIEVRERTREDLRRAVERERTGRTV